MGTQRLARLAPPVIAAVLSLAACGSDAAQDGSDAAAAPERTTASSAATGSTGARPATAAEAAFPIEIEHVYGTTTITRAPERVATVAWANHEVPLALGIVPVGMSKATWGDDDGDGVLPWVEDKLAELGAETPVLFDDTDGIDLEAVADTDPDVILASYSGITREDYDALSEIAPVVAYPEVAWGTSWQDMVRMSSAALGMAAEGDELIAELEAEAAAALAAHPELDGKKIMFAYIDPTDLSQVGFYTSHDTRPGFLAVLRLGDDSAAGLGVNVGRTRLLSMLAAVVLLAFATAASGPVAFVAFMAGPIAVRMVGSGASLVLPSGLVGAGLVLGSDLIAQHAFETRYPVGVVTGLLGAPYLIALLIRTNRSGGSL